MFGSTAGVMLFTIIFTTCSTLPLGDLQANLTLLSTLVAVFLGTDLKSLHISNLQINEN